MTNNRFVIRIVLLLGLVQHSLGFSPSPTLHPQPLERLRTKNHVSPSALKHPSACPRSPIALHMGFFDSISQAFSNNDYETDDQRVSASHILIKGDDVGYVMGKIKQIMGELNERVQEAEGAMGDIATVQPIFSELAKRESQCPSRAEGGDLGSFGPGKMAPEFDAVLFPEKQEGVLPPPVGSLIGPVVTDFGMHIILLTDRSVDRDQVEEKLARND